MGTRDMSIDTMVTLNNHVEMPVLGLGTYQSRSGKETQDAVLAALQAGYRHIDTARVYGNEMDVGEALRMSGVPREEVFITTKLSNEDHGYDTAIRACRTSLKRLGVDYIDLYLIHWPVPGLRGRTWKALERLQDEGLCRAIGVSNFQRWHLEELLRSGSVVPAVDQVEFSPYTYQRDLHGFCTSKGVQLEAYSPLTKGLRLSSPRLLDIASKYVKTPAQLLIRWGLQKGAVVIPKSVNKERIWENANVFDFNILPEDMALLDGFDEDLRTGWDPTKVP